MKTSSAHITDFCSGALSSQEFEAGFAILESSGLARAFSHLARSDEMKETALLEQIVLFLGFGLPPIWLRHGHRCAA